MTYDKDKLKRARYPMLSGVFLSVVPMADSRGENFKKNKDNPFGVLEFLHWDYPWSNYKYASKEDLKKAVNLMQDLGVGFLRLDFLWEDIEKKPGEFNFEKYDNIVTLVRKNRLEILGLLQYSTSWASEDGKWNTPPEDFDSFVNYAAKVIERYKGIIKYWEVWNEPDSYIYWNKQDNLKSYCQLLKKVYTASKKVNPECVILNGGLANGLSSIHKLYDNGAKEYFDILNLHYFDNPYREAAEKALSSFVHTASKIMVSNYDAEKKIWITEIGCPGVKEGKGVENWWLGSNPDEKKQAEWLEIVFKELSQNERVEKFFWAFFRDCDNHWSNGIDYFGLVRWDFSLKPAFFSYKECVVRWKENAKVQ